MSKFEIEKRHAYTNLEPEDYDLHEHLMVSSKKHRKWGFGRVGAFVALPLIGIVLSSGQNISAQEKSLGQPEPKQQMQLSLTPTVITPPLLERGPTEVESQLRTELEALRKDIETLKQADEQTVSAVLPPQGGQLPPPIKESRKLPPLPPPTYTTSSIASSPTPSPQIKTHHLPLNARSVLERELARGWDTAAGTLKRATPLEITEDEPLILAGTFEGGEVTLRYTFSKRLDQITIDLQAGGTEKELTRLLGEAYIKDGEKVWYRRDSTVILRGGTVFIKRDKLEAIPLRTDSQ